MPLDVPVHSALPDGVDPPALLSFLAERFDVESGPTAPVTFVVVDTADRRVRRRPGPGARRDPGHRTGPALAAWHPAGHRPGRPEPAVDGRRPPGGPLRDQIAPVIEMRALLPLARVRADVRSLNVRNEDAKTVVRLRVATHAALDAEGAPAPLASRIEVSGVLGYPRPLARVVAALTAEAGLVAAPASMADEAIAASGGDPGASAPRSTSTCRRACAPTGPRWPSCASSPASPRTTCRAPWPTSTPSSSTTCGWPCAAAARSCAS